MPASNTYESISSITLSNDSSTVTFGSIPSTYTDLILVSRTSNNGSLTRTLAARFNSDTATNYSFTRMYGDGSSAASDRDTNASFIGIGILGNSAIASAGVYITHIMNYSNTTTNKTIISRGSDTSSTYVSMYAGLWRNTSAINSIVIYSSSDSLRSGSTFSLYGIKAA